MAAATTPEQVPATTVETAAAAPETTIPQPVPAPAETPLTAVDHSNKFLCEAFKRRLDAEQQHAQSAATASTAQEQGSTAEEDAAWDEPSSAEDVYRPYLNRKDADGKPLPWGI